MALWGEQTSTRRYDNFKLWVPDFDAVMFPDRALEIRTDGVFRENRDGSGYGPFKVDVSEAVVALLDPIRGRYEALRADERELQRLLAVGAEKARKASEPTLAAMYERMGFVLPQSGRHFGAARPRGL